jgi:hypothetical protein
MLIIAGDVRKGAILTVSHAVKASINKSLFALSAMGPTTFQNYQICK